MKRLLMGLGLGTALVYGWRRLVTADSEPQPTWQGTDNDPEDDASLEGDLLESTRAATVGEAEPAAETPAPESESAERKTRSS
jgi:hypothetical protein